jgi:hypothetical protein
LTCISVFGFSGSIRPDSSLEYGSLDRIVAPTRIAPEVVNQLPWVTRQLEYNPSSFCMVEEHVGYGPGRT